MLSSYPVIDFDKNASKEAGKIYSKLEKKGLSIEIREIMIGAICLLNDASLITRNVKHYSRIEGLGVEKW